METCPGSVATRSSHERDRRVSGQVEASFVCDVRVRVQRDVGHRHRAADDEAVCLGEVPLERVERPVSIFRLPLDHRGVAVCLARIRDEEPDDRDRRLVRVLLEEHPLEHLRAVVPLLGHETRFLPEVPEDRSGLGDRPAVVEDERGHAEIRVQVTEDLGAVGAIDHVELAPLVRDPEVRQEEPHLVAVARDRRVVEEHAATLPAAAAAACSRPGHVASCHA